jgi:NADPH-dependent ferric siderophore reductase
MSEGEKTLYRRTVRGFEPANAYADEWARSCKIGQTVELKGSKPRNAVFHALWWAILGDMAKHATDPITGSPFTARQLHEIAKTGTGVNQVRKVISPKTGEPVWITIPGRTDFAHMDQIEFKRWTVEAATFLCTNFLPGVMPGEFLGDLEDLAAG